MAWWVDVVKARLLCLNLVLFLQSIHASSSYPLEKSRAAFRARTIETDFGYLQDYGRHGEITRRDRKP